MHRRSEQHKSDSLAEPRTRRAHRGESASPEIGCPDCKRYLLRAGCSSFSPVRAQVDSPGWSPGYDGPTMSSPVGAKQGHVTRVSPLQGSRSQEDDETRGFTPGYRISAFQAEGRTCILPQPN